MAGRDDCCELAVSLSAFLSSGPRRAKGRATQGVVGSIPRNRDVLAVYSGSRSETIRNFSLFGKYVSLNSVSVRSPIFIS